ncbi:S1C family serine protease [Laspinema olomoucense]|uniref:Trypsin-like peptidase domain-containing protein n=1 Tax=Laspinema olomoucense D3b TaxID=2953688 RepID=A0ABT2N6A3_9CYAN|nr:MULTISPECIES: trypsin-like peptidase domain-containing protein [unclassified Laspinema]MCT7978234.1 trypsin-like peptidase domain-containing protein [Laspinema sp. D3b]MCT7988307.1 trypsin-like peptidase domain-containing protein [Laspinema sp. D3a]MCT7995803.1 trypsin-like peptidase domain-containing protein [Laspinema sp. D3c]
MKPQRLLLSILTAGAIATSSLVSLPFSTVATAFSADEQTSINVYQQASPSVVTIRVGRGAGSGSIISADGLVLTNDHVVSSARNGRVEVLTSTGQTYTGDVIATDRRNDLALVRLRTSDPLPALPIASRDGIQVGQRVYAIGSPFGLSGTFTTGILSRISDNGDLQTDAAINPGNSGGPLLNSNGELIGVNKAILSPGRGGNIGIGFATSATVAQDFIATNRSRTVAQGTSRTPSPSPSPSESTSPPPRLGVEVNAGLVIQSVERGSPAAQIGLRTGDRLLGVNGTRLRRIEQLMAFLNTRPNSAVFTISRGRRVANVLVNF